MLVMRLGGRGDKCRITPDLTLKKAQSRGTVAVFRVPLIVRSFSAAVAATTSGESQLLKLLRKKVWPFRNGQCPSIRHPQSGAKMQPSAPKDSVGRCFAARSLFVESNRSNESRYTFLKVQLQKSRHRPKSKLDWQSSFGFEVKRSANAQVPTLGCSH